MANIPTSKILRLISTSRLVTLDAPGEVQSSRLCHLPARCVLTEPGSLVAVPEQEMRMGPAASLPGFWPISTVRGNAATCPESVQPTCQRRGLKASAGD